MRPSRVLAASVATLLAHGDDAVLVVDGDGAALGVVTLAAIRARGDELGYTAGSESNSSLPRDAATTARSSIPGQIRISRSITGREFRFR